MLSTLALSQGLAALGFELTGDYYQHAGPVRVRLLDGPRLMLCCPQVGLRYVAVCSLQHLAQEITAFGAAIMPVTLKQCGLKQA